MKTLIKGGRVLDPASKTDAVKDVLFEDGVILKVAENITDDAENVIDADGMFVMPGLIDLHVHFREPGFEHKETIRTGARAAARGGFTTVCAMPNTKPAIDSVEMVRYIIDKAKEVTDINVLPIAAITAGQDGEYITEVDIPVFAHCEDKNLVARGVMNAGEKAKEMGFYGIMNAVEDVIVARDILLAKNTGARLHLCHCSTKDSVRMVELAKKEGLQVTAEVTPHHFTLTEDAITSDDANFKMNPPLRKQEDVDELKEGLSSGIMDCISTDHAPHHKTEKERSFVDAPFGITGLETSVALTITELVDKGVLTPLQMAERMSYTPAQIIKSDRGTLLEGRPADITIIDPADEYVIDSSMFASMGKNTPFNGKTVKGRVRYTIAGGKTVYSYRPGCECIVDKDVPKL